MADAQPLTVRAIGVAEAARRLVGLEALDPTGTTGDVAELARAGRAFSVEGEGAEAVFVVAVRNGCAFVTAAKGGGAIDITAAIDRLLTERTQGLQSLACQTARPGLVRKLKARGWRVSGWVMRKELP